MRKIVAGILRQYGSIMTISHGESTVKVRGFFQPVRSKSWQNLTNVASPLGEVPRGQYVYIGPVGTAGREGDTLILGRKSYLFRRVEAYYFENRPLYLWGLCVEKGVNDTWGSQS